MMRYNLFVTMTYLHLLVMTMGVRSGMEQYLYMEYELAKKLLPVLRKHLFYTSSSFVLSKGRMSSTICTSVIVLSCERW